jgi:hypothetical protein
MYGSRRARRAPLALHQLESRDNPNGTVTASVAGGVLTLTGDDLDNSIDVQQSGPGSITVSGINTTIQGNTNFTGVNSIVANLADGNDIIAISGAIDQDLDGLPDFILPGSVTINAGDGSNTLGLTSNGKIQIGAFSYLGGDGPDFVQVLAGAGKGSKVSGNMSVAVGIGFNSQGPVYADTLINLSNLEITGLGGLKVSGLDGPEQLNLTGLTVPHALSANGGEGNLSVNITGGTFGTVNLKSAGPSAGYSTNALTLTATNTHVTGAVMMKSAVGSALYLAGAETGSITFTSGNGGAGGGFVEVDAGTSTVHGNLKLTGSRLSVYTRTGGFLNVDGALSLVGTGFVDLSLTEGSNVTAGTVTLTGASGASFFSSVGVLAPVLTVNGAMTLRGSTADFYQVGGEVLIAGKLSVIATTHASFRSDVPYGFNAPRANTKAGSLLLQGRSAEYTQTESDATFTTGLSIVAREDATFSTYDRTQTEDPSNPGTFDAAVGSATTVTTGSLAMSGGSSAELFQSDGILTIGGELTILSPGGSASYRADVGDGYDAPAPKLVMATGNVLVRGGSADFLFEGGVAGVGGTVSVLGSDGARFSADFGETHNTNFDFIDLFPTVTAGTVTVNAGVGDAKFASFGDTFTGHGNVVVKGRGLTRVYFQDQTGSQVDGDVLVTSGGDFDSFLAWGPLTIGGNLTVDLGSGSNGFETGIYGGTTKVTGNVIFKSGNGSDTYSLARLEVTGSTSITTGAGTDTVYLLGGSKFSGPVTVDTGGGADLFAAGTALPDPQNPTGPPTFAAGTVEFDAKATIKLGAGNDTMQLGVAGDPVGKVVFGVAGSLAADGGLSLGDFFDAAAGQFDVAKVTTINFELP